jgi:hypothetical protein
VQVEREASLRDERPETGGDYRRGAAVVDLRPLVDPGDLAIAERVADVRDRLRPERGGEPDGVDALQPVPDLLEARDPAEREKGREREQRRADEEDDRLDPRPVDLDSSFDGVITQARILR